MTFSGGRVFRIGLLLVTPYACNGEVPLGDKGHSASGGSSSQGGASTALSGFGGTQAPSGGASASTGGASMSPTGGAPVNDTTSAASTQPSGGNTGSTAVTGGTRSTTAGTSSTAPVSSGGNATGGMNSLVPPTTGGAPSGGAVSTGGTASTGGVNGSGGAGGATGGATTVASTSSAPECVTSTVGAFWKTTALTTPGSASADVTVNDTATGGQTWEGFGGTFNELGWSYLTTQEMKDQAVRLLFGTDGANFTWGRIPIGASDYAMSRYTLDDPASGNDPAPNGESTRPAADPSLTNFSIDRDKQKLIPYIHAALAVKPDIRFWASPWTPPVWMKTGFKTNSGADSSQPAKRPSYYDGGSFSGTSTNLNAYAQYYTKWVQAYSDEGIKVEYVSPQNEPGYDQNYPSCLWDKVAYVAWVKTLHQAMNPLGVKVMLGTLSNAGDNGRSDLDIADAVLGDAAAKAAVSVVGAQWGVLDRVNSGWSSGGLPIWATEHKAGNYPWTTEYNSLQAPNDQAFAVESWGYIRDAIVKGKVTAYNAWNMVLDKTGLGIDTSRDWKQDALLVADAGKVTATPAYYVFRHFSQFVVPGAKVLTTTGGDAVAFKNPDGSVVAVMYNAGSAKSAYTAKIGAKYVQFSMPAGGWATVVSR